MAFRFRPVFGMVAGLHDYIMRSLLRTVENICLWCFSCLTSMSFKLAHNVLELNFSLGFETMSTEILLTKLNVYWTFAKNK